MPFQVVFNRYKIPPGIIDTYDAGPDQINICRANNAISAAVIGDTFGHSFEWEGPIAGSSVGVVVTEADRVTPRAPDTVYGGWSGLNLFYQNLGDRDDKTWRFWIDRGTPNAQYDDVTIFGTPISNSYYGRPASIQTLQSAYVDPGVTNPLDREPVLNYLRGFSTTQDVTAFSDDTTNLRLEWNVPSLEGQILQYEIQSADTASGPWTAEIVSAGGPTYYDNPTVGKIYRIAVFVKETNSATAVFYSNTIYVDPQPKGTKSVQKVFSTTQGHFSTSINQQPVDGQYIVVQLRNVVFEAPNDFEASNGDFGLASSLNNVIDQQYSVFLLEKITLDAPVDFQASNGDFGLGTSLQSVEVTNYQVTNLTGGSIGG